MNWFNGTIKSAVDQVKLNNSLLLVFIQGDNELSNKYKEFLDKETSVVPKDCVAIKILTDSVAFEQFKNIYFAVPIPSIFLIGTDGMPLAVVCSDDPYDLVSAIKEVPANVKKECSNESKNKNGQIPVPKDFERYKFLVEDKKIEFQTRQISRTFFLYETHCSCDKTCLSQKVQSARIQFRFPTDEVRSWEFPNMCTLRDVRLYLMETIKLSPGFKLLRVYPRTAFTPQDEQKTLVELSLTPSAILFVVPVQDEAIQTRLKNMIMKSNIILTFLAALFQPVFSVFNYLRRLPFVAPKPEQIEQGKKRRRNDSVPKRFSKKTANNIHGFAFDDSDTDSDMNTDNGNSTQQM